VPSLPPPHNTRTSATQATRRDRMNMECSSAAITGMAAAYTER
jgi:hypothetical protein